MEAIRTKTPIPRRWLGWLIGLMALSTLLFVIGILIERGGEASEGAETHNTPLSLATATISESGEANSEASEHATLITHVENGESGNEVAEGATALPTTHDENSETTAETSNEAPHTETIMGINIENPAFVIMAVVVWAALIVLAMWLGRIVLLPIITVALGTTLFDLAEVAFQISRSNSGLAILAGLVALAHVGVAVAAWIILRQQAPLTTRTRN